jgi:hypothetical protein
MPDEVTTFTRQEFYDYVWSTPLAVQNRDYRLTELRLAALCAKQEVPCPPRGFWKRRSAGAARPQRPPLLPISNPRTRDEIKLTRSNRFGRPLGRKAPKAVSSVVLEAPRLMAPILVPQTLPIGPHKITKSLIIRMDATAPVEKGLLPLVTELPIKLRVSEPLIERAIILLDALLRALVERGCVFSDGRAVYQEADFTLDLCEAETLTPRAGGADALEFEFAPSGRLLLDVNAMRFDSAQTAYRARQWSDCGRPLEDQLPHVVCAMQDLATEMRGLRQAADEARRARGAAELRQRLSEVDQELRSRQRDYLRSLADAFHEVERLKALATYLERQSLIEGGHKLADLRPRLSEMIADTEATLSAEALQSRWGELDRAADRRRQWIVGS